MKKKIYFIISSIIQTIISIYTIITAKEIIKSQINSVKEVYKSFPQEFQNEMISSLQSNGQTIITIFSIIIILLNLITLIIAIKDKILPKRGLLIAFSAITIFCAEMYLTIILSIISLIVLALLQRKNPEDFPVKKEVKQMPQMERNKSRVKDIILGILLVFIYFSSVLWARLLPNSVNIRFAISIANDIFILIASIVIFFKELKVGIINFKNACSAYMKYLLPKVGLMYVTVIVLNIIVMTICNKGNSVNQATLEALPKWYSIPMAVIWAPIVEEVIFRGVLRRIISNNTAFIIVSAIIFGFLHTLAEATLFNFFVMAIPYAAIGGFLAYVYTKTNNIVSNIACHGIYNFVGAMLTLL